MRIITAKEMRMLEQESVNCGVSLDKLMDNAGNALSSFIINLNKGRKIVFLAGRGNNGGDCYIAANELVYNGFDVTVINICGEPDTPLAINAFSKLPTERINIISGYKSEKVKKALEMAEIDFMSHEKSNELEKLKQLEAERIKTVSDAIKNADIVVDGVFGTGFHGELDGELAYFFSLAEDKTTIAVDTPSGGNCTSGAVSDGTFKADYTLTFGFVKTGMMQYPLKKHCGDIICCDIGIPEEALRVIDCNLKINTTEKSYISSLLKKREPDTHKGDFGKLLVIAGSEKMRGACVMAVNAALRCGTGLVCAASTESTINSISIRNPEALLLPMEYDYDGFMLYDSNISELEKELETASAILIGCGLGVTNDTYAIVSKIVEKAKCPVIIDADGINCIARDINILQMKKTDIILTPHPKEMSRLIGADVSSVQSDRIKTALDFAKRYDITVVLKGAGTVIADSGSCLINTTGNSGMSKGGSGDVLAGMIASFAAQGYCVSDAAAMGVYLHGLAGDITAEKYGYEAMLPTDMINELSSSFRCLNEA